MLIETLLLALRAIRQNTLRSALTALGIIIGVAAVTALVTIGNGTTASVVSGVSRLGSNLLTVRPGASGGSPGGARSTAKQFTAADAAAIMDQVPGVKVVAPVASGRTTAIVGNQNWSTSVAGTDDGYFEAGQWTLASGRLFTDSEIRGGSAVCIIGQTVRQHLFGNADPVGQALRLQRMPCNVVGLLASKGAGGFGMDQDDIVAIPLRAFQRRIAGNTDVDYINVAAQADTTTATAQADGRNAATAAPSSWSRRQRRLLGVRHDADHQHPVDHHDRPDGTSGGGSSRQPSGWRHRDHEHHAGVDHRADTRNRHSARNRRATQSGVGAVSG
jgi:putative ABC transport system permease protein